jgi:hypothetical protein
MRIFNRILLIINTLLFLAVGIFFASIINDEVHDSVVRFLQDIITMLNNSKTPVRLSVFSLGIFLIAVGLLTIIGNIEKFRLERTVVLQSPHGEIMVSLSAIEDFSRIVKNQVAGVKDIKGKVRAKRKGLDVSAWVTLYSDKSVADVTQEVQEAIIRYIQYTLGISAEIKPTVIVNKIAYKSDKPAEEKAAAE